MVICTGILATDPGWVAINGGIEHSDYVYPTRVRETSVKVGTGKPGGYRHDHARRDDFKFWSLVSRTRFHSKSKARTSDQVHGNNTRVGDTSIANREFSPSRNLREACEEVPFLAGRGAVVVTFRHTSSFILSSCTPLYTEPSIACDLRVKPVPSRAGSFVHSIEL